MAKYKLTEIGVLDRENNRTIPAHPANRHWKEYQEWLAEGNTPDPVETLEDAKARRKRELNQERLQQIEGGLEWNGHTWDTDRQSRENLTAMVAYLNSGNPLPDGFTWRDADNVDVPLTKDEVIQFGAAMVQFANSVYKRSWAAKAAVDKATAPDEINTVLL